VQTKKHRQKIAAFGRAYIALIAENRSDECDGRNGNTGMVGLLMGIPLGRITKKSHKNHAGVADNPEKNLGNCRQTSKNPPGHSGRIMMLAAQVFAKSVVFKVKCTAAN